MKPTKKASYISGGNFPNWKNKKTKTCSEKNSNIFGNETFYPQA